MTRSDGELIPGFVGDVGNEDTIAYRKGDSVVVKLGLDEDEIVVTIKKVGEKDAAWGGNRVYVVDPDSEYIDKERGIVEGMRIHRAQILRRYNRPNS